MSERARRTRVIPTAQTIRARVHSPPYGKVQVSDSTNPSPTASGASAPDTPKRAPAKRASRTPDTLDGIARAMLRARGIRSDEHLSETKKVLRGKLRGAYWSALTKSAPKSYGSRGSIKREPNDRRPWGKIPADVARAIIKNAR